MYSELNSSHSEKNVGQRRSIDKGRFRPPLNRPFWGWNRVLWVKMSQKALINITSKTHPWWATAPPSCHFDVHFFQQISDYRERFLKSTCKLQPRNLLVSLKRVIALSLGPRKSVFPENFPTKPDFYVKIHEKITQFSAVNRDFHIEPNGAQKRYLSMLFRSIIGETYPKIRCGQAWAHG